MSCQYFSAQIFFVLGRAKIFSAGPGHDSADPRKAFELFSFCDALRASQKRGNLKNLFDGAQLDSTGNGCLPRLSHMLGTGRRARTSALPWVQKEGIGSLLHFRTNPAGRRWTFGCNPAWTCAHHKA